MNRLTETDGLTEVQRDTAEIQKMIIGNRLIEKYRIS